MRPTLCLAAALLLAASSFAQPLPGKKFELSISGGYQHFSSGSSTSSSLFFLSPRFGVFVTEGLEVEPEITSMFTSGADPAYVANGNLAYNFKAQGRALVFVLAGYGIANGIPIEGVVTGGMKDVTFGVLNLGAGVKILFSEDVAVRTEFRYQRFSGTYQNQYWLDVAPQGSASQSYEVTLFSVQFGLTVFL